VRFALSSSRYLSAVHLPRLSRFRKGEKGYTHESDNKSKVAHSQVEDERHSRGSDRVGRGSRRSDSRFAQGKAHAASVATIKIAIVSNSNMLDIEKLTPAFEKMNPGIKVVYDTLDENNERTLIEQDITTHANQFNAVMISNYETPIWAKNGWLVNLSPQLTADKSYDVGDLLKPIANALTYKGGLYSVPFYGESSMVYYRKDLFKKAGLTMPLHPTWVQIAAFAKKLNSSTTAGICLRGLAGWGDNLAALDTVINTSGGSWFNDSWQPQLTSSADEAATNFYVNLVKAAGEPGASSDSFPQCEAAYGAGKAAMWYDATVAAGLIATAFPSVSANTGYAYAPTGSPTGAPGVPSGWLYTWSLSIPKARRMKRRRRSTSSGRARSSTSPTAGRRSAGPISTPALGTRPMRFRSTRRRRRPSRRSRWRRSMERIPTTPRMPM